MEKQTQVKNMMLRSRMQSDKMHKTAMSEPIEIEPVENKWTFRVLHADRLVRNLAVVGVLLLTVIALRSSSYPQAQSVFSALQDSAGMEWDESIGKLSFVNRMLPEALQEVWNPSADVTVYAPVSGEVLHVWSRNEPYVTLKSSTDEIRASADGEVMSIAHGMDEERIIRIRHEDHTETIYGNLRECFVEAGQRVYAGDLIGRLLENQLLAYELRIDGRSVDPAGKMIPFEE